MATAHDVAKYFLLIAAADEDSEGLTHLKLQKLLYYAQGFHLALFGCRLFPDMIEAWDHGPVILSVWQVFRQHGSMPLPVPPIGTSVSLSAEQRDLLNDVWNTYGQFSAWKLRNMTHEEAPWKETPYRNVPITDEALQRYFQTQVTNDRPDHG
ncbi:MAG: putative prophage protein [Rhodospirillaceae bacterium]|nr:MAG: putative prophage protein [Rhodospirillaceae bacterium]